MATPSIAPRLIRRTYQSSIFTWCEPDTAKVTAEVYIRAIDGLFYQLMDYGGVGNWTLNQLYYHTYRRGSYSPRPYSIWQTADSSCVYCVLALMLNLVETQGIDLVAFFGQVNEWPSRRLLPCPEWVRQATWEGVVYPQSSWSQREIEALKRSLTELRLQSLVSVLHRQLPA